MLFSKLKSKEEELLPPPPPFPSMELEEEKEAVSAEIKPKKAKTEVSKDKKFEDLFKEVESLKPKKEKISSQKKELITKKPKIPKKIELKPFKKTPIKKLTLVKQEKEKKLPIKKSTIPKIKEKKPLPLKKLKAGKTTTKLPKPASVKPKPAKTKGFRGTKNAKRFLVKEKLEDLGFILPKEEEISEKAFELPQELESPEEIGLPETLEDFDVEKELGAGLEDFGKYEEAAKPKEILEAEEEIKSAIEKIKEREKPSLFKRLFAKKEKTEEKPEDYFMPEIAAVNDVSTIQNNINRAREALMKFDLETAKRNYVEIMRVYNNIKPEEQAKVYHDIRDLYFERKSAEELKV